MSFGEPIPPLEIFSVSGDPGALHAHANQIQNISQLLDSHSQRITSTSAVLTTSWTGEAAGSYHAYSNVLASHFSGASGLLADGAQTIHSYASALEEFQGQSGNAHRQSQYWHQQIVIWTTSVNDAKVALTDAQADLTNAQNEHSRAVAAGWAARRPRRHSGRYQGRPRSA